MGENRVFIQDNELAGRISTELYLDTKTADATFVFGIDTDHPERVPAHKNLLSAGSPVFDAMFYGPLPEAGDIRIVDASSGAFKEFLQFFYKSPVQLTTQNIDEVMKLCNKYEVPGGVEACEIPFQNSLTNNDMCYGYKVAVLLELPNIQRFCEQKIRDNAQEVLTSDCFLECSRASMDNILQLVESTCNPLTIIKAFMEWAKAENARDFEQNPITLRNQLGNLFDRIPFADISMGEFLEFTSDYPGVVSDEEIRTITRKILEKKFLSSICTTLPLSILPRLECDRRIPGELDMYKVHRFCIGFETNADILLREFYLPQLVSDLDNSGIKTMELFCTIQGPYRKLNGELVFFEKVKLTSENETHIVLPHPVIIEAHHMYCIYVIGLNYTTIEGVSFWQRRQLRGIVEIGNDIKIKFYSKTELSSRLLFQKKDL